MAIIVIGSAYTMKYAKASYNNPVDTTYTGQSTITTLGTILTGVWNGTAIANANLANSSVTVNGTSISLGGSGTATAAAGTLTGTTLNSSVVTSSLTSVGTIATGIWNGTPITSTYLPVGIPTWVKITKSFSDFSTAGLTNTITLATLPAKTIVTASAIYPSTPFTGGLISAYSISLGIASAVDLMPASSTFTTPTRPFASNLAVAGIQGGTQAVTATAISVTGLLNAATAGSVDIYLLESTIQ